MSENMTNQFRLWHSLSYLLKICCHLVNMASLSGLEIQSIQPWLHPSMWCPTFQFRHSWKDKLFWRWSYCAVEKIKKFVISGIWELTTNKFLVTFEVHSLSPSTWSAAYKTDLHAVLCLKMLPCLLLSYRKLNIYLLRMLFSKNNRLSWGLIWIIYSIGFFV